MRNIIRPLLELAVVLPGALLCLVPLHKRLRYTVKKTVFILAPVLLLLCLGGAALCSLLSVRTDVVLYPSIPLLILLYYRLAKQPLWRAAGILLGVFSVFSVLGMLSIAADSLLEPTNSLPWMCLKAALIYNLACWLFVLLCWYPATRKIPWLFERSYLAQFWYIFIIIPAVFITLNLFLIPFNYDNIRPGRPLAAFISIELIILAIVLVSYLLFYLMARGIGRNAELQRENQFLQMQAAQYETLRSAIAETRQARHDLRHHINALSALSDKEDWVTLKNYLRQAGNAIPQTELKRCDNPVVDSVLGYYAAMCRRDSIAFECCAPLPQALPVGEMEVCMVLSNLLENAVEASYRAAPEKRYVKVTLEIHGEHILLLMVENHAVAAPRQKDGVFQSSKRSGEGVGLQSVHRIAENCGGHCQFTYADNVFHANVMLRT